MPGRFRTVVVADGGHGLPETWPRAARDGAGAWSLAFRRC
jgi:hypothetical protein